VKYVSEKQEDDGDGADLDLVEVRWVTDGYIEDF
jgi:hypothetical protein